MRLLIYEWTAYLQYDIKQVLIDKGINISTFSWNFKDKNKDEVFNKWFYDNIDAKCYDALISINYFPILSEVAQTVGMRYIAWCYDNPLNVVDIEDTLANSVNTVVFFDRIQTQFFRDKGFDTVYYMPLAVNTKRISKIKYSQADSTVYSTDISFVGSLYESRLQEIKNVLDEYSKGYIDSGVEVQYDLYGCYLLDSLITDDFIARTNSVIKRQYPHTEFVLRKEAMTFAMASEVTRRERLILLNLLGRRFDTRLYSFHSSDLLKTVKCINAVDYLEEMPKVFMGSKVNLNISLKCIQSGIPLRILDIMAVGGFLLSNYQQEFEEYFVENQEIVVYRSIEEAIEKAGYYIHNEDLRQRIAVNGKRRIDTDFSMVDRMNQIFSIAGL